MLSWMQSNYQERSCEGEIFFHGLVCVYDFLLESSLRAYMELLVVHELFQGVSLIVRHCMIIWLQIQYSVLL